VGQILGAVILAPQKGHAAATPVIITDDLVKFFIGPLVPGIQIKPVRAMFWDTQLKDRGPRIILAIKTMCTHTNSPKTRPVELWRKSRRAGSLLFFFFDSMA